MDHFVDGAFLAMVVDGHLHPRLPLVVPDRQLPRDEHEISVFLVCVVEEGKRDRKNLLAFKVIDMLKVHRTDGLVIQRMHRRHSSLQ
ncbi:unannotated protein [freshwater metagenome]|uniref:Unannotated protein n=1 Tax=freshwater metagenome TaxID=449393 RepID=A0A6J6IFM5_9ZZZZ